MSAGPEGKPRRFSRVQVIVDAIFGIRMILVPFSAIFSSIPHSFNRINIVDRSGTGWQLAAQARAVRPP